MLPFTADVLFASVEAYNRSLWPLHLLAVLLALAAIALTLRPMPHGNRAIAAVLAASWLSTGTGWFYVHFATIDFVAPLYALLFVLEGLLIAWAGLVRDGVAFRFRADLSGWTGLALALAALVGCALADGLAGPGWPGIRLVGLAPGPTAVFTLGFLLLTERRTPLRLAVVPLLWMLVAGATGWVLGIPQDQALPLAGLCGFALIVRRNRRQLAGERRGSAGPGREQDRRQPQRGLGHRGHDRDPDQHQEEERDRGARDPADRVSR
jgi:hypothetical protein